jgi:MerR family transcriptional regulator, copper efflux regulator
MQGAAMKNLSTQYVTIGTLAQRTGLAVSAIRYYEEIGLVPQASRKPSGHRVYGPDAEQLLALIRRCRDFGFSLDDTKALASLAASQDRGCVEARDIAQVHLHAVRAKLAELNALEASLDQFVQTCNAQCAGGPAPQCSILKDLGEPSPVSRGCCG